MNDLVDDLVGVPLDDFLDDFLGEPLDDLLDGLVGEPLDDCSCHSSGIRQKCNLYRRFP